MWSSLKFGDRVLGEGVWVGFRLHELEGDRVLKVGHHLVAEVQVVVPGFVQQVAAAQVGLDHLLLGHGAGQEVDGQQGEAHLRGRNSWCETHWKNTTPQPQYPLPRMHSRPPLHTHTTPET